MSSRAASRAASRPDLSALAELAASFARAYPTLATRLASPSADPDVERLLEAFADLAERVHRGLDADATRTAQFFSELSMPELARPLPSATVVEVTTTGHERVAISGGCEFESIPMDGTRCRFRAACSFDVVPWTLEQAEITWSADAGQELVLWLRSTAPAALSSFLPLRLYLAGDPRVARSLLLYLRCHLAGTELRARRDPELRLDLGTAVRPWGLTASDALLPAETDEHPGYRLIREYYTLPEKLAFVELPLPDHVDATQSVHEVELRLRFDAPWPRALSVGRDNVRINCVPVANVFETTADPVRPSLERPRQALRPAGLAPGHGEAYAVRRVWARTSDHTGVRRLAQASEFQAASFDDSVPGAFFVVEPASALGSELQLTVGTDEGCPPPPIEFLSIELWATNARLARSLGIGDVRQLAPGSAQNLRVRNVSAVTPQRPPAVGAEFRWRALAASALSAAPLARTDSLRTLLHLLNLHPLADAQAARAHQQRMASIADVTCRSAEPLHADVKVQDAPFGSTFGGFDVEILLQDAGFEDEGDALLFGSMLAALYAHQAPLNTFVRTTVRMLGSGRTFRFPARHGDHFFEPEL